MKPLRQATLLASFSVLIVALSVNAVVAYRSTLRLIENERLVAHSQSVLAELAETLSSVKDAGTGQRGYIITGADSYLGPYRSALAEIDGHLRRLRTLTADNARQQERIAVLESKIAERLRLLRLGLERRRSEGEQGARQPWAPAPASTCCTPRGSSAARPPSS